MAKGHDHDHGEEVLEFSAKKPSKLKSLDADALIHVDGIEDGSFAVASSKKELKALMKSDADVVYDEKKGKLYLNANGEEKGWGKKKVGGLIARFKGNPELRAEQFGGWMHLMQLWGTMIMTTAIAMTVTPKIRLLRIEKH